MQLAQGSKRISHLQQGPVGVRTDEQIAEWSARSPLGRLAETSDVAAMTLFLASADADYCTGQAMNVTGGKSMKVDQYCLS